MCKEFPDDVQVFCSSETFLPEKFEVSPIPEPWLCHRFMKWVLARVHALCPFPGPAHERQHRWTTDEEYQTNHEEPSVLDVTTSSAKQNVYLISVYHNSKQQRTYFCRIGKQSSTLASLPLLPTKKTRFQIGSSQTPKISVAQSLFIGSNAMKTIHLQSKALDSKPFTDLHLRIVFLHKWSEILSVQFHFQMTISKSTITLHLNSRNCNTSVHDIEKL